MKRLLILFGVLDIITLIRMYRQVLNLFTHIHNFSWFTIPNILMYISLFFSAYFLLKQNKVGCWLTYVQLPLRLFFYIPSFGFLITLNKNILEDPYYIIWIIIGLEILRLVFTILIHRKLRTTSTVVA